MQNVHPRATMGWPHWAKQGLEMISQQVSSYSATNVTHTPIQVIRGSNWRLKQWKLAEMDNSRINHLTISTPVLSSHLQLLCFPLFTLNEQLSTWEDLQCGFQDEITKQKQKGLLRAATAPLSPSPPRVTVVNTSLIMGCLLSKVVTNPQLDLKGWETILLKDQWPVLRALKGKHLHIIQWWNSKKASAIVK